MPDITVFKNPDPIDQLAEIYPWEWVCWRGHPVGVPEDGDGYGTQQHALRAALFHHRLCHS